MRKFNIDYNKGNLSLIQTNLPYINDDQILVKTLYSAVSIGTELNTLRFAKNNIFKKGILRKDIFLKVLKKFQTDGFISTFNLIKNKLSKVISLGYSSSGQIVSVGKNIKDLKVGDYIACYGQNYASHSEYISTYANMVCKVDNKFLKESSYCMMGAISLNSVRISNIKYGNKVLIIGAGLLGSILAKILNAYGHDIDIIDIDTNKKNIFSKDKNINFNTYDSLKNHYKDEYDICFITSNSDSSKPIEFAIENLKFNSEIIILGITNISLNRNIGWEKQISIKISKAGGLGSLDRAYEQSSEDFPDYIKESSLKKNISEFLRLIQNERIDLNFLVKKSYNFLDAEKVFTEFIKNPKLYDNLLFKYDRNVKKKNNLIKINDSQNNKNKINLAVLGTGNFSRSIVLPKLNKINYINFFILFSFDNNETALIGEKYKFNFITSNLNNIFSSKKIGFIIAPIKNSYHFDIIDLSVKNHKRLLIEKPICINIKDLNYIRNNFFNKKNIFIGHNRRYSKHVYYVLKEIDNKRIKEIKIEAYPGLVDKSHWVYSNKEGGNRSINEMTHYIDLVIHFSKQNNFKIINAVSHSNPHEHRLDNIEISLKAANEIHANLKYFPNKKNKYREIIKIITQDNYEYEILDFKKTLIIKNSKKIKVFKTGKQDLGYDEMYKLFFDKTYQDNNFKDAIEGLKVYFDSIRNI